MADIVLRQIDNLPMMPITAWNGVVPVSAGNVTQQLSLGQFRSDLLFDAALTGAPTAPTPNLGDNTARIATTAYVQTQLAGAGLNPATSANYGVVRTNSTDAVPTVYLKGEVDGLLAQTTPINRGGTGATTAADARANLGTAASGNNSDIIALTALAAVPSIIQAAINALVPAGMIALWNSYALPTGWLLCNGAAVSRTTYAALFAAIGTAYGAGDGSTTFALPNLQGRVVMGAGTSPASGINRAVGVTGGAEAHTLTTNEMPSHSHAPGTGTGFLSSVPSGGGANVDGGTVFALSNTTANTGNGQPHNNLQPFITLNYIIKF